MTLRSAACILSLVVVSAPNLVSAFPAWLPTVTISLASDAEGDSRLECSEPGRGLPSDFTWNDDCALRGVKAVSIDVYAPRTRDQVLRPLTPEITAAAQSILKQAGLEIVSQEERRAKLATPELRLIVYEYDERSQGRAVYHIFASLRERMQLERDPSVLVPGSTWGTQETVMLMDDPETTILRAVENVLTKFVDDLRAANSTQQDDAQD